MVLVPLFLLASVFACSSTGDSPPAPSGGDAGDAGTDVAPNVEVDDANLIPCAPRRVLQTVCQKCHTKPPRNGAPFPLVTRSNIIRMSADGQIRELMIQQLEVRRMPLAPETIDEGERTILLEWLRDGAGALDEPRTCAEESADAGK